jgi:ubiquitin conjugation factor E4 B
LLRSQDPPPSSPLAPHLLLDPEDDRGVCHDFLTEASLRAVDDESISQALVEAVEELSGQLGSMTLNDDYKPYVLVGSPICVSEKKKKKLLTE